MDSQRKVLLPYVLMVLKSSFKKCIHRSHSRKTSWNYKTITCHRWEINPEAHRGLLAVNRPWSSWCWRSPVSPGICPLHRYRGLRDSWAWKQIKINQSPKQWLLVWAVTGVGMEYETKTCRDYYQGFFPAKVKKRPPKLSSSPSGSVQVSTLPHLLINVTKTEAHRKWEGWAYILPTPHSAHSPPLLKIH